MKIGIIGTGNIAPAYVKGCANFPEDIQLTTCADLVLERAQLFAARHGLQAQTINGLLANPEIELIINLTIPAAHASVSQQIINAGKHVYVEKPLALNREAGKAVLDAAVAKGVRVGCAPDTFLGSGGETARQVVQSGAIGKPLSATAFMCNHGHESWHPNPSFYYQPGGGPLFDMGPYYLTALVNLLGPIATVSGFTGRGFDTRTAEHESIKGDVLPVDVDTHIAGTMAFTNGTIATMIMSFDIWTHHLPCIEIYGTLGTMSVPDPNRFDGEVKVWRRETNEWETAEPVGRDDIERGVGVADMARSIRANAPHRASGQLAYHVLDAMEAFGDSAESGRHIQLTSTV